jgi:hypothetical protein
MRRIAEKTGITLSESATSYETEWNESENLLLIKTGKGEH